MSFRPVALFGCELVGAASATNNISYVYDADGIRVQTNVNGVATYLVVDKNRPYAQVLEERDSLNAHLVSYVYGDDLISQAQGGTTSYYHYDGLGSVRGLTDAVAALTDAYTYEAFGELIAAVGTSTNQYLYTGEQLDQAIDLYYMRARYYDYKVGRFAGMDLFPGLQHDPITLHKYLYANANAVMFVDPGGKFAILQVLAVLNTLATMASAGLTVYNLWRGNYKEAAIDIAVAGIFGFVGGFKHGWKAIKWWKKGRNIRKAYNAGVASMRSTVYSMRNAGASSKKIAEVLVPMRNSAKVKARKFMDPKEVRILERKNRKKYKHPIGPSIEWMLNEYGSYDAIIDASMRTSIWFNLLFMTFR